MNNALAKGVALLLLMLGFFVSGSVAQTYNKHDPSFRALRVTINNFLTVWLVKKDTDRALTFFSRRAFLNKGMLSEFCAGYIKDEERSSPNKVKEGVKRFLYESSADKTNKTLDDWLTKETSTNFDEELVFKKAAIPLTKSAKYWLYKITPGLIKHGWVDDTGFSYKKNHFTIRKTTMLLVGLKIDDHGAKITAYLHFFWLIEKNKWKIVDAGMFCM